MGVVIEFSQYLLSYHNSFFFSCLIFSASTSVQYIQGNGNCDIISEHSRQYLYSIIRGYCGSRFTSSVACFLETGMPNSVCKIFSILQKWFLNCNCTIFLCS